MSLLGSLKANKSINVLIDAQHVSPVELKEAFNRIKDIGPSAVPKLIIAFAESPTNAHIESILVNLLDNKTLPDYIDGLAYDDKRVVNGTMRVLAKSNQYDPNRLFELFEDAEIPKTALVQILISHKEKLNAKALMAMLGTVEKDIRQIIFRVLEQVITVDMVPELIQFTKSADVNTRLHVTRSISKFNTELVRDTLIRMLSDENKAVKQAALTGLGNIKVKVASRHIVPLLKDPDLTVQGKAIEALIKIQDPDVVNYLIDILQDDSEYIRRAAVEVLNEVNDPRAIKDLLSAMRDKDWWVKVRAADALGSIGGSKVVDAVVGLINDKDEFLRRTAVEILNVIKDERAVKHLILALEDSDWWVRERATDALATLGDTNAVMPLVKMMQTHQDSIGIALKALASLGDTRAINPMIDLLGKCDDSVKKDIIKSLEKLTDDKNYEKVQAALKGTMMGANSDVADLANDTMQTVLARLEGGEPSTPTQTERTAETPDNKPKTTTEKTIVSQNAVIDANSLKEGDQIDNRYRVIKQVGKGAFGVVLLVEDQMVHEEIILKFLNAHMASDESVIKRFVSELKLTRRITHENVIRIYDFITFGKSSAISMEYFESRSLSQEIRAGKTKDFKRVTNILIDICKGLSVAHNINVVHRDIKPANILVDDNDLVKIVDFGLAAASSSGDARLTKSGILVGTPTYMAPEQVRGRKIDTRTDIYSLGIVMYELYTGKPPYKEKDHMATLFKHVEGKAIPAKQKNPEISDELNRIIMKAIHLDAMQRYQTVDELRMDLEAFYRKELN